MNVNNTQPPSILPIPSEPVYSNKEIYEASQGNVIRNSDDELSLTPQGQLNLSNKQDTNAAEQTAQAQAQKDEQRVSAADLLGHKSKQSQVEIYLAVATDGEVGTKSGSTASIIETLRDVQKQNNAVEAYATYQTNQDTNLLR